MSGGTAMIDSLEAEYRRYKALGEAAMAQMTDEALCLEPADGSNSVATIVWHIAGNLESRFTDFRTTDGEKPWRQRDEEFAARQVRRDEVMEKWERGWRALFAALAELTDDDVGQVVTIRDQPLRIDQALHRSVAHTAYHVGQIVYLAKLQAASAWRSLSIPKGGSAAYNQAPSLERPSAHARVLSTTADAPLNGQGLRIAEVPAGSEIAQLLMAELDRDLQQRYPGMPPFGLGPRDIDLPGTRFVVVSVDNEPVACGALRPLDVGVAEIKRMYVRASRRGRGLARATLAALEVMAKQSGVRCIKLETGARQPEAIHLYQSSGFTEIALYGDYVGSPFSRCFEKLLA